MIPVPVQTEHHETQGLMGSDNDDDDDVSPKQTLMHANNANIPLHNTSNMNPNEAPQESQPAAAKNRISRRDVNRRIQSYLRESDENCRESATLVAIVIIGLVVTGSVIGFLQLGHHDPSAIHKGSHASVTHFDGEALPSSLPQWIKDKSNEIDREIKDNTLDSEETLGIQPLYRNYLLQTIYEYSYQSAIRIDKNDPIFQHISMTYGGPWSVPKVAGDNNDNNERRRTQQSDDDDDSMVDDSETEKVVFDDISNIEMISLENGRNDHTVSFVDYKNNVNEWHCYIFEFANADQLVVNKEFWKDYSFRISARIHSFEMESGYDFVRIYVNSQLLEESLTGNYVDKELFLSRVDFDYLSAWNENDIPSLEVCFNIITDESVTAKGFDITTSIEYENPESVTWNDNECIVSSPTWRNPSRWDGSCGIGVHTKTISACGDRGSALYAGVCHIGETQSTYCNKLDCGDASPVNNNEIKSNPKLRFHYNGRGRIDPTYANPFNVYRSTNTEIDIDAIISSLTRMRDDIGGEYEDVRVLTASVSSHASMDDSRIRLGLKLARSLLLGDTFHVVFSGSSNTAGHDNLFMSSYPMQLQSILRPLWREIGFKGAAFRVSNRAVGGAIGTNELAWCIPQLSGGNAEKVDVVVWESIMNDAGSDASRSHSMEEHLRNSLSLAGGTYNGAVANRPVWHAIIAGSNGDEPDSFEKTKKMKHIYSGYADLISEYSAFGAGIVEFIPSNGMNPMKAKDAKNWNDEHFYVTWHPGPVGHRIYAEIIAYFYLNAALDVLKDVQRTVKDLESVQDVEIARPVLEMLDLLQDAPYKSGLPLDDKKRKCSPICSDAANQYCLMGFNPKDSVYELKKYVIEENGWKYERIAGNPQPISTKKGGQASIDTKYGFKGNKNSGELVVSVKIGGNNYLLVEKPYADWGGLNDVIKQMPKWFRAKIIEVTDIATSVKKEKEKQIGKILKCQNGANNKHLWNTNIMEFGCVLKFEYPGKYKVAFTVETEEDIPLCVFASF